jgi:hypothetical protein
MIVRPLGAEGIAHLVNDYFPKHGMDPVKQVQVLCLPTRGEVGTRQLNVCRVDAPVEHRSFRRQCEPSEAHYSQNSGKEERV